MLELLARPVHIIITLATALVTRSFGRLWLYATFCSVRLIASYSCSVVPLAHLLSFSCFSLIQTSHILLSVRYSPQRPESLTLVLRLAHARLLSYS